MYVFDDKLVFTYNYKNWTQTAALADVSAAFGSDLKFQAPLKTNRKAKALWFGKRKFGYLNKKALSVCPSEYA